MKDPILKTGTARDGLLIKVYGGLHYIKGNSAPHFTVGADAINPLRRGDKIDRCGCLHEEILELFPDFAPLVALHLSDIDGVPMHAASKAIYWAAGVLGGDRPLGQQYHGGSGSSAKDGAECLRILGKHLRVDEKEATRLVGALNKAYKHRGLKEMVADYMGGYVEGCKPRWEAEADAVIKQFNLVVYGDAWIGSAA